MKITPSVAKLLKGFPKKEHDIDTITGTPECKALNLLINDLWENAASMATLKGGGKFGHILHCACHQWTMQPSHAVYHS